MRFVHDPKYIQDAGMIVRSKLIDRSICSMLVAFPTIITLTMLNIHGYLFIVPLVFVFIFLGVFINAEIKSHQAKNKADIQRFLVQLKTWFKETTDRTATDADLRKLLHKSDEFIINDYRFVRSVSEDLAIISVEKILSDTTSVSRLAQLRREELRKNFPHDRIFL